MSLHPDILIPGNGQFSDHERAAVYRVIFERRDVRRNFLRKPIADDVLARILTAAHHAGSVGFMQPWDFVVIRQRATKRAVKQLFQKTNAQAAMRYEGARATLYRSLKLEGIEEAPVNIGVTCSRQRGGRSCAGPFHGARYGFVQHLLRHPKSLAGCTSGRHRCWMGQHSGPWSIETDARYPEAGQSAGLSLSRLCIGLCDTA